MEKTQEAYFKEEHQVGKWGGETSNVGACFNTFDPEFLDRTDAEHTGTEG